jgi:hypothetical protein
VASRRRFRLRPEVGLALLSLAAPVYALDPPAPDKPAVPDKGAEKAPADKGAADKSAPDKVRAGNEVSLLRTVIVSGPEPAAGARPSAREASFVAKAHQLDLALSDALQDFGLTLDLSERANENDQELTDVELVTRATKSGRWIVYPTLDVRGGDLTFRLAGVAPGSKIVFVRTEVVKPNELALRATVMLRDLVTARQAAVSAGEATPGRVDRVEPAPLAVRARSLGRATLAFNSALFGAFVGYSVQRSSGSDDPRLLFPLLALGTGIGLGASAIVAEEWDVGLGDAWFLSAAAWWPALSGLMLARSRERSEPSTEPSFALVGAVSGLGLATTSLVLVGGMSQGGALMTHSGGAFGTLLGGMTELAVRGSTEGDAPYRGLGYGAGIGVVLAGTVATFVDIEPSRVLAIDLGAGLGGLAGAAATSPFIFRERTSSGDRAFLIATMGATAAGGVAAWLWTRKTPARTSWPSAVPYAGVVAESWDRSPVLGVGLSGPIF